MTRVIALDFRGAPPAQGGGAVRIPPGRYRLEVMDFAEDRSKAGNRMLTANFKVVAGPLVGTQLRDRFALEGTSKFPIQRLHACFIGLGLPVGEKAFNLDLDKLAGRTCDAEVGDDAPFTRNDGSESVSSKVFAYYAVPGAQAANPASNGATAAAAPVINGASAVPAPVQAVEAPVPAPTSASVAVAEPETMELDMTEVEADIDKLFH